MSKRNKNRGKKRFKLLPDNRKVCILVPCDDHVKTEFAMSLVEMVQHTYQEAPANLTGLGIQAFGSTILPYSRQTLARRAVESGATHSLWIDSDMRFPRDMLLRFLRLDEKIVGINAMSRREPYRNCAQVIENHPMVTTPESTGLEKVHRMGFGVMWVATSVFKQMDMPYFDFEYLPEKMVWRGEDFDFFERARALGHPFYVDQDLSKEVYHMGSFGFNPLMMNMVNMHLPNTQPDGDKT